MNTCEKVKQKKNNVEADHRGTGNVKQRINAQVTLRAGTMELIKWMCVCNEEDQENKIGSMRSKLTDRKSNKR